MFKIIKPMTNQENSNPKSTPNARPSQAHNPSESPSTSIGTSLDFETPPGRVCSLRENSKLSMRCMDSIVIFYVNSFEECCMCIIT